MYADSKEQLNFLWSYIAGQTFFPQAIIYMTCDINCCYYKVHQVSMNHSLENIHTNNPGCVQIHLELIQDLQNLLLH